MNPHTNITQIIYRLKAQISCTTEALTQLEKLEKQMQLEKFILKLISTKVEELQINPQAVAEFKEKIATIFHKSNIEPIRPPLIINSNCDNSFGAALAPDTENAKKKGKLIQSYPVSVRDNPPRAKDHHNYLEAYPEEKPPGTPFVSAWDAYYFYSRELNETEKYQLMVEITIAKLTQYPRLAETIKRSGGKRWLANCSYLPPIQDEWAGQGLGSKYLTALTEAYTIIYPEDNELQNLPTNLQDSTQTESKKKTILNSLASWLDYDPEVKVALIYFQNEAKAKSWAYHLHHNLYVGNETEISQTLKSGFNYQLNISGITPEEAQEIVNLFPEIATEQEPSIEIIAM